MTTRSGSTSRSTSTRANSTRWGRRTSRAICFSRKDELHDTLSLKAPDIFSISKRNADIQRLTEKYQDLGYAFVNVIPKMKFNDDVRTVDIEYDFEKGSLVYFGEINVIGNSKTYDKVIRRELKIHEGELYNGTSMRQSKENVERLGYFQPGEVIFNTVTPKGKPDILNVDISVKERSTGTITLGAGYGSIQKFFFTTTISEINFMGRGQTISLSAQYSADTLSQELEHRLHRALHVRHAVDFGRGHLRRDLPGAQQVRHAQARL